MSPVERERRPGGAIPQAPSPNPAGDTQGGRETKATRVITYARCSTREQADEGVSLEAQRMIMDAECRRRGWDVYRRIEDPGFSGKDMNRPGVVLALELMAAGQADALMVSRLDRLSRSLYDFATTMRVAQQEGWALLALDLGVDTSTPSGEMIANVMASFAAYERRIISQRTKDGLAAARANGVRLGRRPQIPPDVEAMIVSRRSEGWPYERIANWLNDEGVPTAGGGVKWHVSTVASVCRRVGVSPG